VSAKESVGLIRQAKKSGLPVTCETAPHYLVLCDADLREDGRFKMNPPLRSREDRQALRDGIADGTVDMIATDHAPHSAAEKSKGLKDSAFGIVGLETSLPLIYTHLVLPGIITMERLVDIMCISPRLRFRLGKGEIAQGRAADLTVFDPGAKYRVDPEKFLTMGRATPFDEAEVRGEIRMTLCDSKTVWDGSGGGIG
jgi:dihydroorotase